MLIGHQLVKLHYQPDFSIKKIEKEADLHKDHLRNINPNHFYECHPSDHRSYFGESSFCLIAKSILNPFCSIQDKTPLILCKNHTILSFFCNILNHLIIFIDFFSIFNYRPSQLFKAGRMPGTPLVSPAPMTSCFRFKACPII